MRIFFEIINILNLISVLVQSAIKRYHRLGGLNNTNLFLRVLEAGKSEIRMPAWSGFREGSLPGL